MQRLWNMVSFIAVVNLLALAGLGGWLWSSGRLDVDRLQAIREMLMQTSDEIAAAEEEAAAAQAAADAAAAAEAEKRDPSLPSSVQVERASLVSARAEQTTRRLRDETDQLLAQLESRLARIDRRETEFSDRQDRWKDEVGADQDRAAEAQFRKAVRLYEAAKPKVAKQWMLDLIADGGIEQVVSYLDAMNPRAASKVLGEFKTGKDVEVATELLERLRTFGVDAEATETAGDDDSLARAAEPATGNGSP